MKTSFKRRQRGITLIGLLFVGAILAAFGVVVAQAVPTVMEYQAVIKAVNKAKEGTTLDDIRTSFDKAAHVDSIKAISGKDLTISRVGDKHVVSFSYQREVHLAGPAYLTLKYAGQSN